MIVQGTVTVPGDKSITHRLLLLAALVRGTSEIRNPLTSLDARSSATVLRRLGAEVSPLRSGRSVRVGGSGRFQAPDRDLYCGNSGTTARLLLGALAGHPFTAKVTGDRSLRRRPMRRITKPLRQMGATVHDDEMDGLPVTITGGPLRPIEYEMPVSSAQLKGSLLLAGLVGEVAVAVRQPMGRSRDHSERLLRSRVTPPRRHSPWAWRCWHREVNCALPGSASTRHEPTTWQCSGAWEQRSESRRGRLRRESR